MSANQNNIRLEHVRSNIEYHTWNIELEDCTAEAVEQLIKLQSGDFFLQSMNSCSVC